MNLLVDDTAHPVVLFAWMAKHHGHDWMGWGPATLRQTLSAEHGVTISTKNTAKLLAAAALATRDEFWEHWTTFHFLAQALNNEPPMAESLQEHSVGQLMAAVDDALFLRASLSSLVPTPPFAEDVARYVAAQALAQGAWWLPAPLAFANEYAGGKHYHCNECGNEAEVTFNDGFCDVCVDRWDTSGLRKWEPDPDIVARGQGRDIEIKWKNPQDAVEKRWNAVKNQQDPAFDPASQVDNCVARLFLGQAYVDARRKNRDAGLAAVA